MYENGTVSMDEDGDLWSLHGLEEVLIQFLQCFDVFLHAMFLCLVSRFFLRNFCGFFHLIVLV